MNRFDVLIEWFDSDCESITIDAESPLEAAEKIWSEWHTTGWEYASIFLPDYWMGIDLEDHVSAYHAITVEKR